MTTENLFEAAPYTSFTQFNAFESAIQNSLKEFPTIVQDSRPITSDTNGISLYDPGQSQPFEITDEQGRVIASAPDSRDNIRDITDSGNVISNSDVDGAAEYGCSNCGCNEYAVRGWNRTAMNAAVQSQQFSSCDDGSCDDGDDYDPGDDGGDCDPDDGGCGPGGGLLSGLLGRFGRLGMLGRLFGGGGRMGFGRFLR